MCENIAMTHNQRCKVQIQAALEAWSGWGKGKNEDEMWETCSEEGTHVAYQRSSAPAAR